MGGRPHGASVGICRIGWVRIAFGPDGPRCRVVGTRHRRPVTWTVPFHRAVALMADGVPGVISGSHGVASPVVGRGAVAAS